MKPVTGEPPGVQCVMNLQRLLQLFFILGVKVPFVNCFNG